MPASDLLAALVLLVGASLATSAQDNPFLGKWDISGVGPNSNHVYWLEVKMEDGQLAGYFLNRGGSVLKLPEIKIENNDLIFSPAARAGIPG